jgi:hypothetical protein
MVLAMEVLESVASSTRNASQTTNNNYLCDSHRFLLDTRRSFVRMCHSNIHTNHLVRRGTVLLELAMERLLVALLDI